MSIIKTENLTYIYGSGTPFEKAAIKDINLEIEKGEFVGIIGHTGSGKSTLMQHFNGLLQPSSGKIYINGRDIWQDKDYRRSVRFKIGLVFQYPEYQIFEETVARDIAYGPKNMGLDDSEIQRRVKEAAGFAGIDTGILDKSPFELSGGQKRRVAIAGVMAMRPDVLVLDEPAAGLDPYGRRSILDRISEYHKTSGSTVLLVSHSMEDVAAYASKVVVMNRSGIAMRGTVDEVFARSSELIGMGLGVPEITRVFAELRRRGFNVNPSVYTVEQGRRELLRVLRSGGDGKNA